MGLFERRRDMRRILQVVDAGSIVAAAKAAGITQPALSRIVGRFERELGMPMFKRQPTGMALTEFGEIVAEELRRLVREMGAAEARIVRSCDIIRNGRRDP